MLGDVPKSVQASQNGKMAPRAEEPHEYGPVRLLSRLALVTAGVVLALAMAETVLRVLEPDVLDVGVRVR